VTDYDPGAPDEADEPYDDLPPISYRAVTVGLPVVTCTGQQFGVVEHVLEVPELDVFDGIVVYTGTGLGAIRPGGGRDGEARTRARMLRLGQARNWLRFVDADQVQNITAGAVTCTFGDDQVALLPAPQGTPVYEPDMAREEQAELHRSFGRWFGRPHWKQK
jgi:hypothetical protein